MSKRNATVIYIFTIIIAFCAGFILTAFFNGKKVEPTIEYQHWILEQDGYNYCPYCGEQIKEKQND